MLVELQGGEGHGLEQDSASVVIEEVELVDSEGRVRNEIAFGDGVTVRIRYNARRRVERPLFGFRILYKGTQIMEASMLIDGYGPDNIEGKGYIECVFNSLPLTPKVYEIFLFARDALGIADIIRSGTYAQFRVTSEGMNRIPTDGPLAITHMREGPVVYAPRMWRWGKEET